MPQSMPAANPLTPRIDASIEALLASLVLYLPFAFGGVLAQSSLVLVLVALVLAALLLARNFFRLARGTAGSGALIALPMLLFVGLAVLQWAPLPMGLASLLAPQHAARSADLIGDAGAKVETLRLSLVPHATLLDLRVLLALCIAFFAGLAVFGERRRSRRFLLVLSLCGSAVAVLGVAQIITGAEGIYWSFPGGSGRSGPFVHYGHYAQFLNLSIGATLALLLQRMLENRGKRSLDADDLIAELRSSGRGFDRWLATSIGLAIIAILMSTSRNGIISLGVAGAITVFAMHRSRFVRGVAWPALALMLVSLLVLFGFGFDPVLDRMQTLSDIESASADRVALLGDTLSLIAHAPVVGSGLGSFEHAFPAFDTTMRPGTAAHAENQYAELMAETGVLGFLLMLVTAGLIARAIFVATRSKRGAQRAMAYGAAFGLLAVAFHATTDFGLRIPAVAFAATLMAAAAVAAAQRAERATLASEGQAEPAQRASLRLLTQVAIAVLFALALWQAPGAWRSYEASRAWRRAENLERETYAAKQLGDDAHFTAMTEAAREAASLDPQNIDYRFWALAHEWRAAVARSARAAAEAAAPSDDAKAELKDLGQRLVPELLALVPLAPTYGQTWSMAGQLALAYPRSDDDREKGVRWIRRGFELAPQHPATCLALAELSLYAPDASAAKTVEDRAKLFERALRMGVRWTRVLTTVLGQHQDVTLAHAIAKGNATLLSDLATRLEKLPGFADAAPPIRADAFAIWRQQVDDGTLQAPGAFLSLAREADRTANHEDAVRFYHRYLRSNFPSLERLNLARVLARMERFDDAIRELNIVLRHHPLRKDAKALLVEYEGKAIAAKRK